MSLRRRIAVFLRTSLMAVMAVGAVLSLVPPQAAQAANAANFNPGNIIDDSVFTDTSTMSATDIQNFLNFMVPSCDADGIQQSEYGGGTRAQYGTARGNPPQFTCLKSYWQNPSNGADNYGGGAAPWGSIPASQIIYNVSQQFGINPQVLIVLLQKEQALVTDTWPLRVQYRQATGFACPDTAACDPAYAGFYNQMYQAARHFRNFFDLYSGWSIQYRPGWNSIKWNPSDACGRSDLFIENRATAALYNYTPYRPNAAAMANLYGTGDGCSAYGNRNFWRTFTDWFGDTHAGVSISSSLHVLGIPTGRFTDNPVTATFYITNRKSFAVDIGSMAVAVRNSGSQNFDYPLLHMVIPANSTAVYSATQTFTTEDTYNMTIVNYRPGVGWSDSYPANSVSYQTRVNNPFIQKPPSIDVGLSSSPSSPRVGENASVSFRIKNNSAQPFDVGGVAVGVRGDDGGIYDYPLQNNVITGGGTYTYSAPAKTFPRPGNYRYDIVTYRNGVWANDFPATTGGAIRGTNVTIRPSPTITTGIQLSPSNPRVGQPVTASFTVTNYGDTDVNAGGLAIAVRNPNGGIQDYPLENATVPAHGTYTFSKTQTFTVPGAHRFDVVNYTGVWSLATPVSESGGIVRSLTQDVRPQATVTTGLSLNPSSPRVGQSSTVSFTVTNYGAASIDLGGLAVAVRDPNGVIKDFPLQNATVAGGGGTFTYSAAQTFTVPGQYRFSIVNYRNGVWSDALPPGESGGIARTLTPTVQANPTVTTGLSLSPSSPQAGQSATVGFVVTNHTNQSVNVGGLAVAVRDPQGNVRDYPLRNVTIAANDTYTYSEAQTFTIPGQYRLDIVNYSGGVWSSLTPASENGGILRTITPTVTP